MPEWITNSHGVPTRRMRALSENVTEFYRRAEEIAQELHLREVAMWAAYGHHVLDGGRSWDELPEGVRAAKCNAVRTMIQEGRIRLP